VKEEAFAIIIVIISATAGQLSTDCSELTEAIFYTCIIEFPDLSFGSDLTGN